MLKNKVNVCVIVVILAMVIASASIAQATCTVNLNPSGTKDYYVGDCQVWTTSISDCCSPRSYQWYIQGNPVSGETGDDFYYCFNQSGTYMISVRVTDCNGHEAFRNFTADVYPCPSCSVDIEGGDRVETGVGWYEFIADPDCDVDVTDYDWKVNGDAVDDGDDRDGDKDDADCEVWLEPGTYEIYVDIDTECENNDAVDRIDITVLEDAPPPNNNPTLSNKSFSVSPQNAQITYKDQDGDSASYVNIFVNDVAYQMYILSGTNPKTGIVYERDFYLSPGTYSYYFKAADSNGGTVRYPSSGSYSVTIPNPNHAPTLSGYSFNKDTQEAKVTYTDQDSDFPSYVKININGTNYTMSQNSSADPKNGIEYHKIFSLSPGTYQYYFHCADSKGATAILPVLGTYSVTIPSPNHAPTLSGYSFNKDTQEAKVTYTDQDSDFPSYVKINVGGTNYTMSQNSSADPKNGIEYRKVLSLSPGTYQYYYHCADSKGATARLPVLGSYSVTIPNQCPVAKAGSDQEVTVGTWVTLNGSGSSDPDNGPSPLTYKWYLDSALIGEGASINRLFEEGTWIVTLKVYDGDCHGQDDVKITVNPLPVGTVKFYIKELGTNQPISNVKIVLAGQTKYTDSNGYCIFENLAPGGYTAQLSKSGYVSGTVGVEIVANQTITKNVLMASSNKCPTANAGSDQEVAEGTNVTLNGNGSSDPDNDPLEYIWTEGSNTLSQSMSFLKVFSVGTHTISLIVSDDECCSLPDTVIVKVYPKLTISLSATDTNPEPNESFTITANVSGGASPYTYKWYVNGSVTSGSTNSITKSHSSEGTYTYRCEVKDKINAVAIKDITITIDHVSQCPVAKAGSDQEVTVGTWVTLNGSGSSDPDNGPSPLTYKWYLDSALIGEGASINRLFEVGTWIVTLKVYDGDCYGQDDVKVKVTPLPVGSYRVTVKNSITNQPISGASVSLGSNNGQTDQSGICLFENINEGTYQLNVSINGYQSFSQNVQVIAYQTTLKDVKLVQINQCPTARAGSDQQVVEGIEVTLNGSASDDPDDYPNPSLSYEWWWNNQKIGTGATVRYTFPVGTNNITLKVNDGDCEKTDQVIITVSDQNQPPVARILNKPLSVDINNRLDMDASSSYDPDGDTLYFSWLQLNGPSIAINNSNKAIAYIIPTVQGFYKFQVNVSDGSCHDSTTVDVYVNDPNVGIDEYDAYYYILDGIDEPLFGIEPVIDDIYSENEDIVHAIITYNDTTIPFDSYIIYQDAVLPITKTLHYLDVPTGKSLLQVNVPINNPQDLVNFFEAYAPQYVNRMKEINAMVPPNEKPYVHLRFDMGHVGERVHEYPHVHLSIATKTKSGNQIPRLSVLSRETIVTRQPFWAHAGDGKTMLLFTNSRRSLSMFLPHLGKILSISLQWVWNVITIWQFSEYGCDAYTEASQEVLSYQNIINNCLSDGVVGECLASYPINLISESDKVNNFTLLKIIINGLGSSVGSSNEVVVELLNPDPYMLWQHQFSSTSNRIAFDNDVLFAAFSLPKNFNYRINFPDINGYITPDPIEITASNQEMTLSVNYFPGIWQIEGCDMNFYENWNMSEEICSIADNGSTASHTSSSLSIVSDNGVEVEVDLSLTNTNSADITLVEVDSEEESSINIAEPVIDESEGDELIDFQLNTISQDIIVEFPALIQIRVPASIVSDPENLVLRYFDNELNRWIEFVDGIEWIYDSYTDTYSISFTIYSLSRYEVMYQSDTSAGEDGSTGSAQDSDGNNSVEDDGDGSSSGSCAIATATYGSELEPKVQSLIRFRDQYLLTNSFGRAAVNTYYRFSPPVAEFIQEHPAAKKASKAVLGPVIWLIAQATD